MAVSARFLGPRTRLTIWPGSRQMYRGHRSGAFKVDDDDDDDDEEEEEEA